MIKITLFKTLAINLLDRSLVELEFDTSKCSFSFNLKLGLFYPILPWKSVRVEKDEKHDKTNKIIDIICPILFDLTLYIEQD